MLRQYAATEESVSIHFTYNDKIVFLLTPQKGQKLSYLHIKGNRLSFYNETEP